MQAVFQNDEIARVEDRNNGRKLFHRDDIFGVVAGPIGESSALRVVP
jgi:hypothetical protein